MQLRIGQSVLAKPPELRLNVHSLLVTDDQKRPILIMLQQPDGTVFFKSAADPDFETVLQQLGVGKNVQYERVEA